MNWAFSVAWLEHLQQKISIKQQQQQQQKSQKQKHLIVYLIFCISVITDGVAFQSLNDR